jgi:hypothetical protein
MRSPRVRYCSFTRSCQIYCYKLAVDYWASPFIAGLPCYNSLISATRPALRRVSCSSPPCYVFGFLRIPPRGGHPCLNSHFRSPRRATDFHRLEPVPCLASQLSLPLRGRARESSPRAGIRAQKGYKPAPSVKILIYKTTGYLSRH